MQYFIALFHVQCIFIIESPQGTETVTPIFKVQITDKSLNRY